MLAVAAPLAVFTLLVVLLAGTHDMWRDEVRAFSVATRAPGWGAMLSDLHEEGHPAVWYVILRAGYAITHSRLVLPFAAAIAGIGCAALVLRFAPFVLGARLSILYGAFLGYELSVVARNYGIGVLFMFAACAFFTQRSRRPFALAIMLALMANTSVHAAAGSAILLLLWLADAFDVERKSALVRPQSLAAVAVVIVGIGFALWTARPPEAMAYSFSLADLSPGALARAVLIDPGAGLKGANGADMLAAGEIPWARLGLDAVVVARVLVNAALLWLAWGLRRNVKALAAVILAVMGFEIIFRIVYTGGLRHEALLFMLIVAVCWIAVADTAIAHRAATKRRITLGLAPLLLVQTAALPFVAWRHIRKPESMGHQLAARITKDPRMAEAILMSEPDPLMETLAYYVPNPIYFPRQREFDYRAYFDNGTKRQRDLTLRRLMTIADSVGCAENKPVLLSIGHRRFFMRPSGEVPGPYESTFRWTPEEKEQFRKRFELLPYYAGATGDENYRTFFRPAGCLSG